VDLIFVIILGGLWGSFANVCIYRLPQDKGVVSGRSYCPKCKKKIIWYDNIPIISYFLLGGKCRKCKKKISGQYALVEFISILSFLCIYYLYGITLTTVLLMILNLSFIIIFFIDLKHFIIPNVLTFSMMALGFIKSFDPNLNSMFPNYINSLIGGLLGYGIIWSIIFFYKQIRKKEGMGLGDAKLFAVIGFWFGWISIPFVIFLSSIIALISVVPDLMKNSKKLSTQIPFGPYIILGTLVYLIFEKKIDSLFYF
jgi:leader peptidase (prepilin peptidase)/N-methyltransferase|tara:strand:- start:325 stop:1089 length:765 start_codon:yes stop_codon:yes gene_type:complete